MFRLFLAALILVPIVSVGHATEAGWALLRNGGQIVLLTHADAPGVGEPANFDIENCRTQRNLSERGRLQARRMGALIAARAAPMEEVYSSRYCRTRETADLAFYGGEFEELEALDPFEAESEVAATRIEEIVAIAEQYSGSGNLFLVTHPETVLVLTGQRVRAGEATIVAPDDTGLVRIGRIVFN
jgi:phosphohistidine phosphatase SixA